MVEIKPRPLCVRQTLPLLMGTYLLKAIVKSHVLSASDNKVWEICFLSSFLCFFFFILLRLERGGSKIKLLFQRMQVQVPASTWPLISVRESRVSGDPSLSSGLHGHRHTCGTQTCLVLRLVLFQFPRCWGHRCATQISYLLPVMLCLTTAGAGWRGREAVCL